jgi:hypothetical protein
MTWEVGYLIASKDRHFTVSTTEDEKLSDSPSTQDEVSAGS